MQAVASSLLGTQSHAWVSHRAGQGSVPQWPQGLDEPGSRRKSDGPESPWVTPRTWTCVICDEANDIIQAQVKSATLQL